MDKVDIVLATYNGEKYLVQQLDSIIAQTHNNWRLLISDDGSTDDTLAVIKKYSETDQRIVLVNKDRQGGVVHNFIKALEYVDADYIMFCDQDDYWMPEKIMHLMVTIDNETKLIGNIPVLVFSDLIIVDENLNILDESFYESTGLNPLNNLDSCFLLWRSTVYGCSVMFNRALYNIAYPFSPEVTMHDQWFALIASISGRIVYTDKRLVYYRQHENNIVGAKRKNFMECFKGALDSIKKIKRAAKLTNKTACRLFGDQENKILNKLYFVWQSFLQFLPTL